MEPQGGFRLATDARPHTWAKSTTDTRALSVPGAPTLRRASCWHGADNVAFSVVAPDEKPYRLSVYLLDFDRNGRSMHVSVRDELAQTLDRRSVSTTETAQGVYLSWTVTGPVNLVLDKEAGHNVVASGVFVDPVRQ
jgi:hypothetical protein